MLSVSRKAAVLAAFLFGMVGLVAQSEGEAKQDPPTQEPAQQDPAAELKAFLDHYGAKTGAQMVVGASVKLEDGWHWLPAAKAQEFLVDNGNQRDPSVRGIALPPGGYDSGIFMVYTYSEDGHIEDEEPDYDELLETMQEQAREGSKQRKAAGLQGVELVGWAEPPHYNKEEHKLYWAKELQFEGEPTRTLNYNVRVLGRTANVEINGVGGMEQLADVAAQCKELLRVTEFVEGKRYEDFDPSYDKVAAYGIGGLIAGKLALKAGLFAKLGILLVKFLKPILVGVAVLGGLLFKVFGGRKKAAEEQVQPAVEE